MAVVAGRETPRLDRLQRVPARDVWPHEARDFTPWLLDNADVLGDLLGMELTLESAEHAVGAFSLDLIGIDVTTGKRVIVENQLETSDHGHLGQLLTYAAGTDPTTVVWICTNLQEEHRAALDWLNERTGEATRFFGVEIDVVRIGASAPAPNFQLVVEPNDWEKTARARAASASSDPKGSAYVSFWTAWIDLLRRERPTWSRAHRPPKGSWFSMGAGVTGVSWTTSFVKRGLAVELYFEDPDPTVNDERLAVLQRRWPALREAYGDGDLELQEMAGRKATRVATYLPDADVRDETQWRRYLEWALGCHVRLRAAVEQTGGVPRPSTDGV